MKSLPLALMGIVALAGALFSQRGPAPPTDLWFQQVVVKSPRPVLVKFGADWCPPCRQMESVLDAAQSKLAGRVKVVRIDVDKKPHLASHYHVSAIPRTLLLQEGKVIGDAGGFADADSLDSWVRSRTR